MRGKGDLVVLLTLGICLTAAPAYGATTAGLPGDTNHNGNGTYNHNAFSIRSPTRNSGLQAISNANAGGASSSRNALCRHVRFCRIHQVSFP
ncbi:hypothetical protein [Actinoallomurus acaciae]|uniref:Secreted protein n=1 Tax=Actinoallomurus acaciae TaxID=502577 RepID=A0ABV5YPC1_9ACTN